MILMSKFGKKEKMPVIILKMTLHLSWSAEDIARLATEIMNRIRIRGSLGNPMISLSSFLKTCLHIIIIIGFYNYNCPLMYIVLSSKAGCRTSGSIWKTREYHLVCHRLP